MDLIKEIVSRAQANKQRIVLPEGTEERTLKAANQILTDEVADLILLGNRSEIEEAAKKWGLGNISKATIIDPATSPKKEEYAQLLFELRKKKGMTIEEAHQKVQDPLFYGCLMIKAGDADGQLAQIAVCTARTAKAVAGIDPKVAMLSFSTKGSAKHEVVDKVVEATKLAREMAPGLSIDGELQADAALVPSVGESKAPGSEIAGHANVLIVPNLEVGNISYKLVQRLGHAEAIGPILQGIARPVNDLSRGCSIEDVYTMVAVTANQAIAAKEQK